MFGKKQKRREFKLKKHDEPAVPDEVEAGDGTERHVHFEPPDRSRYPRILDFWPIFLVMAIIVLLAIFFLKWIMSAS